MLSLQGSRGKIQTELQSEQDAVRMVRSLSNNKRRPKTSAMMWQGLRTCQLSCKMHDNCGKCSPKKAGLAIEVHILTKSLA